MNTSLLRHRPILARTAVAALGLVACAAESAPEPESDEVAALDGAVDVPNPSGAYSAKVTATGSGCAPGTWDAEISPDGHELEIHFHAYEAEVSPGVAQSIADCRLTIDLATTRGVSFAVTGFRYDGHATLGRNVYGRATFQKYYFLGNPVPAKELRWSPVGPYDAPLVYEDDPNSGDYVWSPCGTTRRLLHPSRIVVLNTADLAGAGAIDPTGELTEKFTLDWRTC